MTITTRYFGMIADLLDKTAETIELDTTQSDVNVREYLEEKYPRLCAAKYQIAINQEISDVIPAGSQINEIALLPPFAGG